MKIRHIRPTDFSNIFSLWQEAQLAVGEKEREEKDFLSMISQNASSCFVAVEKNIVIGSVFGTFNGRVAWIYHLAIDPKYQRKGYGTKLLKKAEAALVKKGAKKIRLGVLKPNLPVAPFYRKNKYVAIDDMVVMGKS